LKKKKYLKIVMWQVARGAQPTHGGGQKDKPIATRQVPPPRFDPRTSRLDP